MAGAAEPAPTTTGFPYERYRVLAERNIYLKNRQPQPGRITSILRETPVVPIVRRMVVLTGIARSGSEFVAFFEDRASGMTTRVRGESSLLGGRIAEINIDYVEYEKDGLVNRIRLGETVPETLARESAPPAPAVKNALPTPASSAPSAYPVAAPIDEARILEQMRQRRRLEVGAE